MDEIIDKRKYEGVLCECLLHTCPYGVPVTWDFYRVIREVVELLGGNMRVMLPDHVCLQEKVVFECDTFLITQEGKD